MLEQLFDAPLLAFWLHRMCVGNEKLPQPPRVRGGMSGHKAIMTCSKMTQVPLTPATIKTVEQHAHDDGMRGLKIRTSKGDLSWDSSWTAGVEHGEDADDRDCESDESDDDSDSVSESEASFEEEISPEELQELCNELSDVRCHDMTSSTRCHGFTSASSCLHLDLQVWCSHACLS